MDEATLQIHLQKLKNIQDDYYNMELESKTGRLKKQRESASSRQSYVIKRCRGYLRKNTELKEFLTPENSTETGNIYFWGEFFSPQWFSKDMAEAILKIEKLLNQK